MGKATGQVEMVSDRNGSSNEALAFVALLLANVALAFGPFLVRIADVGPTAAAFWRLAFAVPLIFGAAYVFRQPVRIPRKWVLLLIAVAAFFFAADLAAWHAGALLTKLGNATLFGNVSSFIFAAWGLWLIRSWPSALQSAALILAALGCALLMWGSAELSASHLRGDLLALLAGLLYAVYLIVVDRTRGEIKPLPLLFFASLFGAAMLLPATLATGERIIPDDWTVVVTLAISSQLVGQGLLVYALGQLPPIVVGIALLTQPALSAALGWYFYGEIMTPLDGFGAVLIVIALVLVRLRGRPRTASDRA